MQNLIVMVLAAMAVLASETRGISSGKLSESGRITRQAGRRLIVTTVLEPPYMMLKKEGAFLAGNDRFEGYLADMLSKLASRLHFEYEIRLVQDGKYGSSGENGSWSGMIGELQRGEADIAAGSLTITPERERIVDFSIPFMTFRSTALLRRPKRRKIRIHTAEDLLASNIPYGLIQNGITQQSFQETNNDTYRQMWAHMATFWPPVFTQSNQEGVERARRERYAFILDAPTAMYIANLKPCDLYTTEPFLDRRQYAFALRKDNRLKDLMDTELIRMQAGEEMQMMYLEWWRGECDMVEETTKRPRGTRTERDLYITTTTEPLPWRYATAKSVQENGAKQITNTHNILILTISILLCLYRL